MINTSRTLLIGSLITGSIFLAGCTLPGMSSTTKTPATSPAPAGAAPAANQKAGTSSKSGRVTEAGGKFFLNVTGQPPVEMDTYSVDLKQYVGQSVTVTGQYSGDTLFVSEVK